MRGRRTHDSRGHRLRTPCNRARHSCDGWPTEARGSAGAGRLVVESRARPRLARDAPAARDDYRIGVELAETDGDVVACLRAPRALPAGRRAPASGTDSART